MAGGVLDFIEGLGKKGLTFLEKEIEVIDEDIEGIGDNKGVYPATFKGEVLEKYDPYAEDDGDHEAHGAETEVPAADQDAQWFPAVKKVGVSKIAAVAAPGASIGGDTDSNKESSTFDSNNPMAGALAVDTLGGRRKAAGAGDPHHAHGHHANGGDTGDNISSNAGDNISGAKHGSGSGVGLNDIQGGSDRNDGADDTANAAHTSASITESGASSSRRSNPAPHTAHRHHANGRSAGGGAGGNVSSNAGDNISGAKRGSASGVGSNDTQGGSDRNDGAGNPATAAHTSASIPEGGASPSRRSNTADDGGSSPHATPKGASTSKAVDNEEDKDDAHNASSTHSKTKKAHAAAFRKHHHHNHLHPSASDGDTTAADNVDKNADKNTAEENGNEHEKSPKDESASTMFDKKAPSLIADLDDLSGKGKKAKIRKETLRGAKRTLQDPHKLFKDPERLAAARSGDPETIKHSLKRHGRVIVPRDDADPKDIRADPNKLKSIRSNPNKAIRGVIDMGQQYGMDPFEGIDPADVQDIIEHHAAEHPHRKHKVPYVPPAISKDDSENEEELDPSDSAIDGDSDPDTSHDRRIKSKKKARKHTDIADNSYDSAQNDMDEEDNGDNGDDNDGDDAPSYPKLEDAAELDPDDPDKAIMRRKKNNKKKRSYPKTYCNNRAPSDLQLACDSLSTMASSGDDGRGGGGKDKVSDDAPLHKKKAHAAKKMLKCLNRVRSFQQDPAACEGAFVDEAADAGAVVAGLSPNDIEDHYYALKAVSERYNALSDPKDSEDNDLDTAEDDDAAQKADSNRDDDQENYNEENDGDDEASDNSEDENYPDDNHPSHSHKQSQTKVSHASRHKEAYTDSESSTAYGSNIIINQGDAYADTTTPDIEMVLPSNQFPYTTVRAPASSYDARQYAEGSDDSNASNGSNADDAVGDATDDATGNGDDPMSQIMGMAMGLFLEKNKASKVERTLSKTEKTAKSVEGAVGTISKTEKKLAKVESMGHKAATASSKIKSLKGAKANYAKMINLCSNPMDNVTEAENALSMVDELAQHPDAVINQADALINAAQQGIGALAKAQSPEDAMIALMSIAAQINNGGDDNDDEEDDDATSTAIDTTTGAVIDPTTAQSEQENYDNEQTVPAEFANAGKYGDE